MRSTTLRMSIWVVAVVVATAVGLAAVNLVGASVRGRGPLGDEVDRQADIGSRVQQDPDAPTVRRTFGGVFGRFETACQGALALGERPEPNRTAGWRLVSYEPGPDDDVDVVFRNKVRSIELEVFCNRGRPTLAEVERNRLPPS